jgi:hypothetical protein
MHHSEARAPDLTNVRVILPQREAYSVQWLMAYALANGGF